VETSDVLAPGAADASVRPATAADLAAIGAVQARAWTAAYADLLPAEVLAEMGPEPFATAWRPAVTTPPSPRHRVLVACSGPTVVGFCASDSRGEIVALLVDPAHQRHGHGSRLLAATVDTLREDGLGTVSTWSPADDGPRRAFLGSAGFGPDGTARDLDMPGERTMREVRLVAGLT